MSVRAPRVVLTALGTLGDHAPMFTLAPLLRARGVEPVLACSPRYRAAADAIGVSFRPVGIDFPPETVANVHRLLAGDRGPAALQSPTLTLHKLEIFARHVLRPFLGPALRDFAGVAADFVLATEHALWAPAICRRHGTAWGTLHLSPIDLPSCTYRPDGTPASPSEATQTQRAWAVARLATARTMIPVLRDVYAEFDCEPPADIISESSAGQLNLLATDPAWVPPACDWPSTVVETGIIRVADPPGVDDIDLPTRAFLERQDAPPVAVITFGSMAADFATRLYDVSIRAVRAAGMRVLVIGGWSSAAVACDEWTHHVPSIPHRHVLPHAALAVHHGGTGTTGSCLTFGVPQVLVPFDYPDQIDSAMRAERHGIGLHLPLPAMLAGDPDGMLTRAVATQRTLRERAIRLRNRLVPDGAERAADALVRAAECGRRCAGRLEPS